MVSRATRVREQWLSFTSHFLPEHVRADPERHRTGRNAVGVLVVGGLFAAQWVPVYPLLMPSDPTGWALAAGLLGVAALAAGLLYACRWSHVGAAHGFCAYAGAYFLAAACCTGGPSSFVAIWNLVLPLCAMLVGGRRAGFVWVGLALGEYGLLFALAQAGALPPNLVPPELRPALSALSVVSLTLMVLLLGVVSEASHATALQALAAVRARLVAARDAAEAASRSKADFLANASHEIRTPMTAILGFSELLLADSDEERLAEPDRDALETLRRNAARLLDLINDILDLARLEAGRLELVTAPFSPAELLRDALAAFRPEAQRKGLALEIDLAPLPERVYGDRARVAQVLLHLVGNAIESTERGRVTLRASYGAPRLRIDVADTGSEIRPEQVERMFEPFARAEAAAAGIRGGGLGFALCRRLVERMRGEIRVESSAGGGAAFSVGVDLPESGSAEAGRGPDATRLSCGSAAAAELREGESLWGSVERYLLPPAVRGDPERATRARIALAGALLPLVFIPPLAAMFAWLLPARTAQGLIAAQAVLVAAGLGVAWRFRRTGSAALSFALLPGFYVGFYLVVTAATGGLESPHLSWIALLPPFALAVAGRAGSIPWSAVGALLPLCFLAARSFGIELEDSTLPGARALAWLIVASAQTGLVALLAWTYDRSREASVRGLEQANVALERLRDDAERASRERSEFMANVSHEIRTPMTSVLGFAELLAEEWQGRDPERLEALETIRRNGAHLLALIDDLLDVSRVEEGRLSIRCVPFAPAALATEVAELLRGRATSKGLELRLHLSPSLPARVLGDPTRTRQILVNLLGNAVKFTARGHVELRVDSAPDGAPPALVLSVRDTGDGIAPEKLRRLFERFVQADGEVARRFGGSGLGLSICRRLAELLGGSIEAESTPGVGSCFRVVLPAEIAPEPARPAVPSADGGPRRSGPLHGRVLLAEDGADNQALLSRVLRNAGAEVELAADGAQAREAALAALAEGRPFGAILMDLEMPVLDGRGATRELRARGVTTPIIALSAHTADEARAECLAAGFDDYAAKPIERKAFLETVARWLAPAKPSSGE